MHESETYHGYILSSNASIPITNLGATFTFVQTEESGHSHIVKGKADSSRIVTVATQRLYGVWRRLLSESLVAVVETAFSVVDDALPRAHLFHLLLHFESAVYPKHPAPNHGPVFMPRLRRQPHRQLLHLRPSGHRVRIWGIRHRLLRECLFPPRRRHCIYVHGYWCPVPRASKSASV